MTCFMTLGWKFPAHVFDLHTAYLAASNILLPYNPDETRKRERKRLSDACRAYGIEGWEGIDKPAIAEGDRRRPLARVRPRQAVFDYCEEDVAASTRAAARNAARPRPISAHPTSSTSCTGRITARSPSPKSKRAACRSTCRCGIWCRRTRPPSSNTCCAGSIRAGAAKTPIYTPDGEWSYARFEQLAGEHRHRGRGRAWTAGSSTSMATPSGSCITCPESKGCTRCATASASSCARSIPIGRDGRNRPSLFPFCTATGRNAQAKSLFNAHAGMRSFMVFPPDKIGAYLDWRTQEVGVAAALSGDPALMDAYRGGRRLSRARLRSAA